MARHARACLRARRRPARVRGGRLGRPRAARRGAPAAARTRATARSPCSSRYGTVQRARDARPRHRGARATARSRKLEPPVLAALRLGVFQLAFLDRDPRPRRRRGVGRAGQGATSPRGAGLVNAVLRRAVARGARRSSPRCPSDTPAQAALRHSHPEWIAALWWEALGAEAARALMAADNEPAETALRANTLSIAPERSLAALCRPGRPTSRRPRRSCSTAPFDAFALARCGRQGLFMPQSRAAMAVARLLDPAAGRARARPVRRARRQDDPPRRADGRPRARSWRSSSTPAAPTRCARTAARMGADDRRGAHRATPPAATSPRRFDRVLVDPPCSDLGTLASRPDARWRKAGRAGGAGRAAARRSSRAGADALRPGGTLVYSTCTISPAENEQLVERFPGRSRRNSRPTTCAPTRPVWEHPTMPRHLQTLPHRDRTDGFFIARLRRRSA